MALAVSALLAVHWSLAVRSLVRENPTIDEVVHLPAGISYWQTGTFGFYAHNPPLVKLLAALPVLVQGDLTTKPLYESPYWHEIVPNKMALAHEFARLNAGQYFELFTRARLVVPWFSVLGGLVVFLWSRRLHGSGGGLLSLALWCFCPNILAHARLVTTDVGATVIGFAATYVFWRYLKRPSWGWAVAAGVLLGLAQLTKFSMLLLYGLWPWLWLVHEVARGERMGRWRRVGRAALQGVAMVALSVLVIDLGYGCQGVGKPLGEFPFVSGTLTRPREYPILNQPRPTHLYARIREYRVNRFKGTPLQHLPVPLPEHYLSGFDEQKLEADGVWVRFLNRPEIGDRMPPEEANRLAGYPVYLDGVLRDESWSYYYVMTLIYKVPEGTWVLATLGIAVLLGSRRGRAEWADKLTVLAVPAVVLGVMSFLTNINLGLRYVLPIFPYIFVSTGRLAPWAAGLTGWRRWVAGSVVGASLTATVVATLAIHPHYLAYFNWASGGPSRGSEHLIDSNLDWGQDLIGLRDWLRRPPGEGPVGLAYFGQVPPVIFAARGEPFPWFLPPPRPGTMEVLPPRYRTRAPEGWRIEPGLYAVSASLVRGLPWRVYDATPFPLDDPRAWAPYPAQSDAFSYFKELTPLDHVGHSILLYRVTPQDAERLARVVLRPGADE